MIQKSPNKSCSIDPIPTSLLKTCIDELAPAITTIINGSLQNGKMPKCLKHSIVTPRIKKPNLPFEPKSFRPVANLSFLSKLIAQALINQLNEHFETNNLNEPLQSGYKPYHSTQTALIRILNDMLRAIDDGNVVMLALLDLSAAFDVINHDIFLSRMVNSQGIHCAV